MLYSTMQKTAVMTRAIYGLTSVAFLQLGFVLTFFNTDQNIYNLLAAGVGALVARFFFPKVPIGASVSGWFIGLAVAMVYARSVFKAGVFHEAFTEESVFATVAAAGDIVVQVIAWLVRLADKGGKYVETDTKAAIGDTIEQGEKILGFWVRIKAPFLDLLTTAKSLFNQPKS